MITRLKYKKNSKENKKKEGEGLTSSQIISKMDITTYFDKIENEIKNSFSNKIKLKEDIAREMNLSDKKNLSKGKKTKPSKETAFIHLLKKTLKDSGCSIVFEGGTGPTLSSNKFNGSSYSPDFYIEELKIVGEIKYAKLSLKRLGEAIGQSYAYLSIPGYHPKNKEPMSFEYGLVIYCCPEENTKSEPLTKFIERVRKLKVYVIIV